MIIDNPQDNTISEELIDELYNDKDSWETGFQYIDGVKGAMEILSMIQNCSKTNVYMLR